MRAAPRRAAAARLAAACTLGALAILPTACRDAGRAVVVYTSVDRNYSEPVLDRFAAESGIEVRAVYDLEAAKTTGLVNRLLAERERPQADVWWNGEFVQTLVLDARGALAPYRSPAAADLPPAFVDDDAMWAGFGGRARVFLVNTERLAPEDYPRSVDDLLRSSPADQIGLAYPLFGTTATHAAALYALLGREEARRFFETVRDRGVRVVDGNSVVRDLVADGRLAFGLTDTDDACGAVRRGAPVALVFPDQEPGGRGTLVVPNTVALVAGAPHPTEGRALIDHLLRPETEAELLEAGWFQVTLRPVDTKTDCPVPPDLRAMDVGLAQIFGLTEVAQTELAEVFVR